MTCGVVHSIEPRAQAAAAENGALGGGVAAGSLIKSVQNRRSAIVAGTGDALVLGNQEPGDLASYIVRVRMEDGSFRTIFEHQRPPFSVGEKVRLINGSIITVG